MQLKNGFVLESVGGAYLAVAVGEEAVMANALIRMNATGAFIWRLLSEGDYTEEQLVEAMLGEYDVPRELAERDIRAFIAKITEAGLLR
nr:PqqD family protein [Clostridia bacterium]